MIGHAPTRRLGFALLLGLAGCAGAGTPPPASPVTATVEQEGRFLSLVGPKAQHDPPFFGIPGTNFYCLRSLLNRKTGDTVHQLYVEDSYSGAERNWNAARDADGTELRFVAISKNKITCDNGCSYAEEFAAALPGAELRAHPQGLTVLFAAGSGAQMTVPVPAKAIAEQLAAVDAARAKLPIAAASLRLTASSVRR